MDDTVQCFLYIFKYPKENLLVCSWILRLTKLFYLLQSYWEGEGGGGKRPPTSFSPVTSSSVGINPSNFLTCSFNPFPILGAKFQGHT